MRSRTLPLVSLALATLLGVAALANQQEGADEATLPAAQSGVSGVAAGEVVPFTVQERIPVLEDEGLYPCTECHDGDYVVTNPEVRELVDMHDETEIDLVHGGGRFWCLTCHHAEDRDQLTTLEGEAVSFDESHLVCGQCHFERQRDFLFGTHGKRVGGWRGERLLTACTECHDSHRPQIDPRQPYRAPGVRTGLSKPPRTPHHGSMPWEGEETAAAHEEGADAEGESHE